MKLYQITTFVLIFNIFSSQSYGGDSKMIDKTVALAEKMGQELQAESDKLKAKYKGVIITEQEAIKIAKEYLQHKEYKNVYDKENRTSAKYLINENYEYSYKIDWEHPQIRLERWALKKDGSLSSGFGKKVLVWAVWFLPLDGTNLDKGITRVSIDIDAKTGKVFTKYSLDKL